MTVRANEERLNVSVPDRNDLIIQTADPNKATALACSFGWLMRSPISGAIEDNDERKTCEKKLRAIGRSVPWEPDD